MAIRAPSITSYPPSRDYLTEETELTSHSLSIDHRAALPLHRGHAHAHRPADHLTVTGLVPIPAIEDAARETIGTGAEAELQRGTGRGTEAGAGRDGIQARGVIVGSSGTRGIIIEGMAMVITAEAVDEALGAPSTRRWQRQKHMPERRSRRIGSMSETCRTAARTRTSRMP